MKGQTFLDELSRSPIDVPRAALQFAREIAYPEMDVGHYLAFLDQLARAASKLLSPAGSIRQHAHSVADFLFSRVGFKGNTDNYADPRNSYLNEVLDRRLGIPISLSVVYIAVAGRLGLRAQGIGLPGHFIVGVEDEQGILYIDPFHGGRPLTLDDCAALVRETTGSTEPFHPAWLNPSTPKETLVRMLNNLKQIYLSQEDWALAVSVIEHLRMLEPEVPAHLRDLGILHQQSGSLSQAVRFYEQYLLRVPGAADAEEVRKSMEAAAYTLAMRN